MSELVLAIDAGSPISSAALASHGRLLAEAAAESRSGTRLLALVGDCFRRAECEAGALTAVIAVAGPGSFTGVRITLATALGLAPDSAGDRRPALRTISTLAALALHAPPPSDRLLAVVDALRGELFTQPFAREDGAWRPEREPSRIAVDALSFAAEPPAPVFSNRELPLDWPHGIHCVPQLAGQVACVASRSPEPDPALFSDLVRPIYLRDAATTPPRDRTR